MRCETFPQWLSGPCLSHKGGIFRLQLCVLVTETQLFGSVSAVVAFHAVLTTNVALDDSTDDPVKFDRVLTNEGNG